jgi:hypothetical protein
VRTAPKELVDVQAPGYIPFKLHLGDDETVFVLPKNGPLHKALERLEWYSLATRRLMATHSFVEVKPSPIGGLGLFATKDFVPGDVIISERPLVSALDFP